MRLVALTCAATIAGASGCSLLFDPSSSTDDACELDPGPSGISLGPFRPFVGTTQAPIDASVESPSASCDDVVIVVSLAWRGAGNSVTGVRWDDRPLQSVPELGAGPASNQWFYLTDPAPSTTGELTITFDAPADSELIVHAGVLTGVNQTAPIAANEGDHTTFQPNENFDISEAVSAAQLLMATVSSPGGALSVVGGPELWNQRQGVALTTVGAAANGPDPTLSFSIEAAAEQTVTYSSLLISSAN